MLSHNHRCHPEVTQTQTHRYVPIDKIWKNEYIKCNHVRKWHWYGYADEDRPFSFLRGVGATVFLCNVMYWEWGEQILIAKTKNYM